MTSEPLHRVVRQTVDSVLETMFFTSIVDVAQEHQAAPVVQASVRFYGRRSGAFGISLTESAARMLAGALLGEEEETITPTQAGDVACELANILCGSIVHKLNPTDSCELAPPKLESSLDDAGFVQSFGLETGTLTVRLEVEEALP